MAKRMMIDAIHPDETRVAIVDDNNLIDFDFTTTAKKQLKGNVYLAKITRVEPSLQAAFVEYGGGKQGFLPFSEIHPDYYQIPVSDKKRLMEEAEAEAEEDERPNEEHEESESPAETANDTEEKADKSEEQDNDPSELPDSVDAKEEPAAKEGQEEPKNTPPASAKAKTEPTPEVSKEVTEEDAKADKDQANTANDEDADKKEENIEEKEETAQSAEGEAEKAESDSDEEEPDGKTRRRRGRGRGRNRRTRGKKDESEDTSGDADSGVETLPSEEEEMQRRKKKNYARRYKIQEVIRRGQIVLVQVIKEERGNKGVSLTTYLSLAGRYCVLMPNSPKDGGISRKISSADDRKRLKAISNELKLAEGMSVIIRTAGMDRTRAEIKRDYDYLVKVWNGIREGTLKSVAPTLVYEESDVVKRAIRDQYTSDIDEILVEGDEGYQAAKNFMKLLLPSHTPKVKQYKGATPLFYAHNIEDQLLSMHDPVVKLKSGGYIVIDPTEALISIDVNSGRATSERNIEETALKTNLETAAEVARQLRLRDLAGLIVIDFIDMTEGRNRRAVERALKEALKMDRAKIQLGRISPFGLLEMSRQRLRPSISETSMVQCGHCNGRGFVRSNESMSIQMIRALEKEASTGNWNGLRLVLPQQIALHLLNTKRDMIKNIEESYNLTIQILIDANMNTSEFNLEKMRRSPSERKQAREDSRKGKERPARGRKKKTDSTEEETTETNESTDKNTEEAKPKGRTRRGRGGNKRRTQKADDAEKDNTEESAGTSKEDEKPKRGRRKTSSSAAAKTANTKGDDTQDNSKTNDNTPSDAKSLPNFATEAPKYQEEPKEPEPTAAIHAMPATPRDPSLPAKKGWWQKMIQLDD